MSLFCRECSTPLDKPYKVLYFLGHTKTGLVHPTETLCRDLICEMHTIKTIDAIDSSVLQGSSSIDDLIFAIAPGIKLGGDNFNGRYSIGQADTLKDRGNFEQTVYFTGKVFREKFRSSFESFLDEVPYWTANEHGLYRKAIEQFYQNEQDST